MEILSLSHVSKQFGKNPVIRDLSFSIPEHTVFGFIGENGAGKTTAMKLILGLLHMDAGEITVCGEKVRFGQNKTNRFIGYLPDVPEFYDFMTPAEYLALCGTVTGMDAREACNRASELLELVGLQETEKRIHGFSRGMKQRLGIAQALLNRPKLLICDEPTSALDPSGRKEILDVLCAIKDSTTVLFSTHILSDVERICDAFAFLHHGSVTLQGTIEEAKHMHKDNGFCVELLCPGDADVLRAAFPEAQIAGRTGLLFQKKGEIDMLGVMEFLVKHHIPLQRMELLEPTLETLFMEAVGK